MEPGTGFDAERPDFLGDRTGAANAARWTVCTENLNPDIVVMKSAQNQERFEGSGSLNRSRDRRILFQRPMGSDGRVRTISVFDADAPRPRQ
jgi:hypothetical protein